MKNPSVFAIAAASVLVFVCAASTAQDKPNTTAAKKSSGSVTSSSKAAKATAQTPTQLNSTNAKALGERSGIKQSTPAANQIAPAMDRAHESCHGKDSDA